MSPKSPVSFYQNPSVQKMIDDQFVEWDKAKRKELLKQIQIKSRVAMIFCHSRLRHLPPGCAIKWR
jgi:hypothetical protein